MNVPDDRGSPLPLYGLIERATDGRTRIVAEFICPRAAADGQRLLAWAGTPTTLVLISAVRADEAAP